MTGPQSQSGGNAPQEKCENDTIKSYWWRLLDNYQVGVIPLPLFILCGALIGLQCLSGQLKPDIVMMVATLAFFGFLCAEMGRRLPVLGKMGAPAICATFIPSALVYYGWLPTPIVEATKSFYHSSNILYLYICCIIVGSIMSMDRQTLIRGFLRVFIPMLCGEIAGMLVGTVVGALLGLGAFHTFFFLVLPIMAGGVGEGAIPLSMGYAALFHQPQGELLGQVLPIVMLGSLTAILLAGTLNRLGTRYPHLTGNGQLLHGGNHEPLGGLQSMTSSMPLPATLAAAALMAILLYMLGMLVEKWIGLPAPVGMLFAAVLLKLVNGVSPRLLAGSQVVYKFFQIAVTAPVLFAVGLAITPWQTLLAAFTLSNLIVIIATVVSLVTTGFFVGKWMGLYPIDVAVVSCCQSGQGGTGDIAILSTAERMALMPFAQIATRVGGAINVALALFILHLWW